MKYNKSLHVPLEMPEPKLTNEELEDFDDEKKDAGQLLSDLREEWGMSKAEVASKVGVDEAMIDRIEQGLQLPFQETAKRLGKLFQVDWNLFQ